MDLETKQYVESLDLDALARWLCLIEGVEFIFDKLEDDQMEDNYLFRSKKSFNVLQRSLVKYINQRFETMKWDIKSQTQNS